MNEMTNEEFRARLLKPLDKIRHEKYLEEQANTIQPPIKKDYEPSTLNKYVSNPTGKGSGYVASRGSIKRSLEGAFVKLLKEHRKAFYAIPYIYPNGDILFWVKVPSEYYKENSISYDALFLLEYDKNKERKNRDMTVYCNSPSFIFTYCYVYNKHNLLIPKLKSKLPREALTMPPEIRNPIQSFGFEKITYFAANYLITGRCLTDEYINRFGKNIDETNEETEVIRKIADPETLLAIYQHAQYEMRKSHRTEMDEAHKQQMRSIKNDYKKSQKKIIPKKGMIVQRSPRSKITARKAKRSLMNDNRK